MNETGIAIVGMSCRFPGAENIELFWQNLRDGVESVSFFSEQELISSGLDPAMLDNPYYVRARAILPDIELFDASFFGFSPGEVEMMDPQHRLFLEEAWKALEHAGYDPDSYEGLIGVYAGVGLNTYLLNNLYPYLNFSEPATAFQGIIGNSSNFLTTRVSYKLNLKGPSVNVQTACSTSLVAVHLACQSLLYGECDLALAGGVTIYVPQKTGYVYQEGMIFSPDGHCRAFDTQANGIVSGNGVGIVVLKRLTDAIDDGDYIHAIIRGTAINNDGLLKVGYTAPSVDGQAAVIAEAQAIAGVDAETITYIEAHGTGTVLGDPIEIRALTQAFQENTQKKGFCAIGSVKTNFGHLDAAAGAAGLIKTVLALEHKLLPPSLNFERPNPTIDFENSPFYVNATLSEWKPVLDSDRGTDEIPRRAGVSSFGIGGTNAHIVLEEFKSRKSKAESRKSKTRLERLLVISAKTESALETGTANLAEHLKQHPDINLADVAYTLQRGRKRFNHRRILVCQTYDETVNLLKTLDSKRVLTGFQEAEKRPVVFMFPGQGAQYVNMALGLYEREPTFREQVDRCSELLKPLMRIDLRHILYPGSAPNTVDLRSGLKKIPPNPPLKKGRKEHVPPFPKGGLGGILADGMPALPGLEQTAVTQPAIFVIEYALAKLWMEWGIYPQAMIGHSVGEYVAACLAGVFSLEDALTILTARAQLMQQLPGGTMLSVPLSETQIQPLLGEELSLAAVNAPNLCVVSGPTGAVDAFQDKLAQEDVACLPLFTSHAFHSKMMEPILEEFSRHVKKVTFDSPQIPWVSTVTGKWITAEEAANPDYWARNLRQTVRFAEGVRQLLKDPAQILLEVGPGRTLSTLAKRCLREKHPPGPPQDEKKHLPGPPQGGIAEQVMLNSLRHPQDNRSDVAFLLTTLGNLWLEGVQVDWSGFHTHKKHHRLPLPTYPFERQRYWIETRSGKTENQDRVSSFEFQVSKKPDIADWFYIPSWKRSACIKARSESECRSWLVFLDECGLGYQLVERLKQDNQDVITVKVNPEFTKLKDREYALNPGQPDDYNALLNDLRALDKIPNRIIHLWSVTNNGHPESETERFDNAQDNGFYSLLFLAQVLGRENSTNEIQLTVISNNMQEVTGEDLLYPEKTTVLGPVKVVPQEYPNIRCRSIDVVLPESGSRQEKKLVESLIIDLMVRSYGEEPLKRLLRTSDLIIAYRGDHRWVQTFEPVQLEQPIEASLHLREGGVYLITGGLGGIGLVLAEYLAKTVHAKLILTGRSAFPARNEWKQWLDTHDEHDSISRKILKVGKLEELGAEVVVVSVDVTDQEQMQTAITRSLEQFGQINGVIHAAGLPGGGMIQQKTPEIVESILAPKVRGTLILDALFKNVQLDFFVLCSSLTSILGEFGQVDYCSANAFLDAFAHYSTSKHSTFTVCINWDTWQEVGMAANTMVPLELREWRAKSLQQGILPKEGVDAFSRILRSTFPQVLVSTQDFLIRFEQNSRHLSKIFLAMTGFS